MSPLDVHRTVPMSQFWGVIALVMGKVKINTCLFFNGKIFFFFFLIIYA